MSWSPEVQSSLRGVWESAPVGSWASFDFDNTIVYGDISEALFGYHVAHGLIPDSNLQSFPDVTVGGAQVSAVEDPVDYYEAVRSCGTTGCINYGDYPSAVWLAQVLIGLSVEQFLDRLATICGETTDGFSPKVRHANAGFDIPVLREPIVDLIGNLITNGIRVRVISAGLVWAVRWYVANIVNPALAARFGASVRIELADVMGIGLIMFDSRSGSLTSDRMLLADDAYLESARNRTSQLQLTGLVDGPLTFAEGKIAGASERYGSRAPHFVVGDSAGDLSLWNVAEHRLWLRSGGIEVNAELASLLKRPFLVEEVG